MTSTYSLRCQHGDAMAMIDRMHGLLGRFDGADDAAQIMLLLAKLTQLMRVHFAQEDYCLYPALIASQDPEVAEAAAAFQREMGELWEQFEGFVRRWSTLTAIILHFDEFKGECITIFAAIDDRCTRENDLLFPLVDAASQTSLAA
ncbi:MAG TPA: hemerythrin domain-containing protein [Sphingomicrobium sp.]|nr:hemerythrin domain-containing protein [Sphingomicrobium sp.]